MLQAQTWIFIYISQKNCGWLSCMLIRAVFINFFVETDTFFSGFFDYQKLENSIYIKYLYII